MGPSSEIMHIWKEYRIFILHLLLNFWFDVKCHNQHPWSVYTEFYKIGAAFLLSNTTFRIKTKKTDRLKSPDIVSVQQYV